MSQGYQIIERMIIQETIPDPMRGRILSIVMMDSGLVPLGNLTIGFLGEWIGVVAALCIMGSICVLTAMVVVFRNKSIIKNIFKGEVPIVDIFEAIQNRRSIGRVKPDPIDRTIIEKLLETASWAPSHHQTEPWKFFVLTGEGRKPLGRTLAEIARETMENPLTEENQKILKKQEEKPYRAPLIIAVAVTPSDNPKAIKIEEIGAVNAAIQNMLLAVHSFGLGAIWRTGHPTYHPKMKELFGLREQDGLLGFIYIGYPDINLPMGKRTPYEKKTVWIDSDRGYF